MFGARAGMEVGPCRLVKELGTGGFGAVWLAEVVANPQVRVAMKFLAPVPANHRDALARFYREFEASTRIFSSQVARPRGCDLDAEPPWIAYEYIEGTTLRELLADGPLEVWDAATVFVGVARGLRNIGDAGVIHRDLSVDNVIVRAHPDRGLDGVIIDCGIASLGEGTQYTHEAVGRMEYQAPEQLQGVDLTPAVDVWQFAVVLVKSLTGHLPFTGKDRGWQMRETMERGPDLRGLPEPFLDLVRACLSLAPQKRPNARQLATRMQQIKHDVTPLESRCLEGVETSVGVDGRIRMYGVLGTASSEVSAHLRRVPIWPFQVEDLMIGDLLTVAKDLPGASAYEVRQMPDPSLREGRERPLEPLTHCPSCAMPLPPDETGLAIWRCPSPRWCPQPLRSRLRRVASALELPLDAEAIEALLASGALRDESDIFSLTKRDIRSVPLFRTSPANEWSPINDRGNQLLHALQANRTMSMRTALSVTSFWPPSLLAKYQTLDDFLSAMRADPPLLARIASQAGLRSATAEPHADDLWQCEVLETWLVAGVRVAPSDAYGPSASLV